MFPAALTLDRSDPPPPRRRRRVRSQRREHRSAIYSRREPGQTVDLPQPTPHTDVDILPRWHPGRERSPMPPRSHGYTRPRTRCTRVELARVPRAASRPPPSAADSRCPKLRRTGDDDWDPKACRVPLAPCETALLNHQYLGEIWTPSADMRLGSRRESQRVSDQGFRSSPRSPHDRHLAYSGSSPVSRRWSKPSSSRIGTPSSWALVILLAPGDSPTTTANVLALTLPGLLPPRALIASSASSRE